MFYRKHRMHFRKEESFHVFYEQNLPFRINVWYSIRQLLLLFWDILHDISIRQTILVEKFAHRLYAMQVSLVNFCYNTENLPSLILFYVPNFGGARPKGWKANVYLCNFTFLTNVTRATQHFGQGENILAAFIFQWFINQIIIKLR